MKTLNISLKGMNCEHCVATVKKAVDALPGIRQSAVGINEARIDFDESLCQPSQVVQAIRSGGGFDVVSFRIEKP